MLEKNNGPLVVLVVKDDPLIRISAATFIEDAGFLALEAANADQAMALLEDERHDIRILFTDIDMPGSMNGLLLASRRAQPPATDPDHRDVRPSLRHRKPPAGGQRVLTKAL
jgi:CheY-like chemotaxis protein